MPNFSPIHIPKGELKAHSVYEAFRRISLQLGQHASDLSAVARGESPDGSGNALIDTSGFFFKPGISTGQIAYGGTGPGESLTLSSTRSATKGFIYLGTVAPRLAFDETNCFFGVGTDTPATRLQVNIAAAGTTTTGQTGTALIRGSYGGTSLFDVAPFQFSAGVYDTAIKPIAGVQIVGPDGTAAMRFVQTGSVAYIQTGIISSGGVVTNANMQLGGQGATYGTTVAFAFARAFFAASNTPTPTQFGVGVNPDSYVGTWKGVMAIVANSATEPALSLFPFNTSAGSVYMELRASTNSTKYMSIDQVASGARIAFYLATTLQGSSQPAISEFGGYKYAILDAHDRRAMTFDSGTLWNDTKTTCLIDIGDTVGGHAGAVMMGIDATTFSRFAIVSSATMLGDQFVGSACPPPRALVEVRNAGSNSAVVLGITRKSGQTADMTDWWDSDGSTKLAKADSAGNFTMPTVTLVTGAALNKILQSDANGLGSWVALSALGGAAALSRVDDTNVTLTLTGSPTTALLAATTITVGWSGTLSVARGGTGSGTATGSFDALSPLTTLGDTLYHDGTHNVRLGGNTTATRKFLRQTGNGSISAAPAWDTILAADIPASALTAGNDTNVTLTTGGSASTALLAAASITAGWTGTLATSRGGTGAASLAAAGIAQLGVANVFTTIQAITIASNIDALDITVPGANTNPAITLTNSTSGNQVFKVAVSGRISFADLEFMSASTGNTFLVVAKSAIGGIVKTFNIDNSIATGADFVMNDGTQSIAGAKTFTGATQLRTDGGSASHVYFADATGTTKRMSLLLTGVTAGQTRQWTVQDTDGTVALTDFAQTWGALQTFKDTQIVIVDDGDTSKKLAHQCSGISTATTRTWTVQDASGTVPLLEITNTFTTRQVITPLTDVVQLQLTSPAGATALSLVVYSTDNAVNVSWIDPAGANFAPSFNINEIGGANAITIINKSTISANRIYKFDNTIASTDIMLTGGTQTSAGAKTFSGACIISGGTRIQVDGTSSHGHFADQTTTSKIAALDLSGLSASVTRKLKLFDFNLSLLVLGDQTATASAGNLGKRDLTNQGAAIASTNLTASAPTGYYRVMYYLEDTTADITAGTIQFQINYTDDVGATTQTGAALVLTATGRDRGVFEVYLASGELSYQTNLTGITATAKYALRVRVFYLG